MSDKSGDKDGGYDQAALAAASREVHMMLLREGSSWGTKACEEMGRVFMTAYRKAARSSCPPLTEDDFGAHIADCIASAHRNSGLPNPEFPNWKLEALLDGIWQLSYEINRLRALKSAEPTPVFEAMNLPQPPFPNAPRPESPPFTNAAAQVASPGSVISAEVSASGREVPAPNGGPRPTNDPAPAAAAPVSANAPAPEAVRDWFEAAFKMVRLSTTSSIVKETFIAEGRRIQAALSSSGNSDIAKRLLELAQWPDVLAIRGMQAALLDAACALSARSSAAEPLKIDRFDLADQSMAAVSKVDLDALEESRENWMRRALRSANAPRTIPVELLDRYEALLVTSERHGNLIIPLFHAIPSGEKWAAVASQLDDMTKDRDHWKREAERSSTTPAEPVAWIVDSTHSGDEKDTDLFWTEGDAQNHAIHNGGVVVPLVRAPRSARQEPSRCEQGTCLVAEGRGVHNRCADGECAYASR